MGGDRATCGGDAPAARPSVLVPHWTKLAEHLDSTRPKDIYESMRPCELRAEPADALGLIGPGAAVAVPLLERWRTKGEETLRVRAARALRGIRAPK